MNYLGASNPSNFKFGSNILYNTVLDTNIYGPTGPKGDAGLGFHIFATAPSYTGLNNIISTGGNVGEFVLITGGDLFVYMGTGSGQTGPGRSYFYAGDITDESKLMGATGPTGPSGQTGPTGPSGNVGAQGPTGSSFTVQNFGNYKILVSTGTNNSVAYDDFVYNGSGLGVKTTTPSGYLTVKNSTLFNIASSTNYFSSIGTNEVGGAQNTSIVLSGHTRGINGGSITYNATTGPAGVSDIGSHIWYTYGGYERMRITPGGKIGLGLSNPTYTLDVNGFGRFVNDLYVSGSMGVGTVTPLYKLDIVGTTRTSSLLAGTGSITNLTSSVMTGTNIHATNLYATNSSLGNFSTSSLNTTTINATTGSITNLTSSVMTGTTIYSDNLNTTTLSATTGSITNLTSSVMTGTTVYSGNLNTTTLSATTGSITNLTSSVMTGTTIYSKNLNTITLSATTGSITNLTSSLMTGTTIYSGNVNTITLSATSGSITNLTCNRMTGANIYASSQFLASQGTTTLPGYSFNGDTNNGIYSPATDNIGVVTNGSERMRIDSTGNVGIANQNPVGLLSVFTNNATSLNSSPGSISSWDNTYSVFGRSYISNGGAIGLGWNSNLGGILTCLQPSVAWNSMNYQALNHRFYVGGSSSGSSSLIISNNGKVGIGNQSPSVILDVSDATSTFGVTSNFFMPNLGGGQTNEIRVGISSSNYSYLSYNQNGTMNLGNQSQTILQGKSTGEVYIPSLSGYGEGYLYVYADQQIAPYFSDRRVKNSIEYVSHSGSLNKILALQPATFKINIDPYSYKLGFIAQDVETIIPEAVDAKKYEYQFLRTSTGSIMLDENGIPMMDMTKPRYKTLDPNAIVATLVNAMKEQTQIIQQQRQEIDALKQNYEDLVNILKQKNILP